MQRNSSQVFIIFSFISLAAIAVLAIYLIKANRDNQYVRDLYNRQNLAVIGRSQERNIDLKSCYADECLKIDDVNYPALESNDKIKEFLNQSIQDEYKSSSFYEKAIERFGMVRPFAMIIRAEEINLSSIKSLFDKYGLKIPENEWGEKVMAPENTKKACGMAADLEMAGASLYTNTLLPQTKDYPDLTYVFTKLRDSSKTNHLAALEKCK